MCGYGSVRTYRTLPPGFADAPCYSDGQKDVAPRSRVCTTAGMSPSGLHVEQIWALDDGTICLLVEREDDPRFEVRVMRGENVIRQNRVHARGSARMLADTWQSTLREPSHPSEPSRPASALPRAR